MYQLGDDGSPVDLLDDLLIRRLDVEQPEVVFIHMKSTNTAEINVTHQYISATKIYLIFPFTVGDCGGNRAAHSQPSTLESSDCTQCKCKWISRTVLYI